MYMKPYMRNSHCSSTHPACAYARSATAERLASLLWGGFVFFGFLFGLWWSAAHTMVAKDAHTMLGHVAALVPKKVLRNSAITRQGLWGLGVSAAVQSRFAVYGLALC